MKLKEDPIDKTFRILKRSTTTTIEDALKIYRWHNCDKPGRVKAAVSHIEQEYGPLEVFGTACISDGVLDRLPDDLRQVVNDSVPDSNPLEPEETWAEALSKKQFVDAVKIKGKKNASKVS
jgi:hypothetical protein